MHLFLALYLIRSPSRYLVFTNFIIPSLGQLFAREFSLIKCGEFPLQNINWTWIHLDLGIQIEAELDGIQIEA